MKNGRNCLKIMFICIYCFEVLLWESYKIEKQPWIQIYCISEVEYSCTWHFVIHILTYEVSQLIIQWPTNSSWARFFSLFAGENNFVCGLSSKVISMWTDVWDQAQMSNEVPAQCTHGAILVYRCSCDMRLMFFSITKPSPWWPECGTLKHICLWTSTMKGLVI
jgi:hypothetical protein